MKLKPVSNKFLYFGLLLSLFVSSPVAARKVIELDRIIAVVDDRVITKSELNRRIYVLKKRLKEDKVKLPPESVFRKQMLEQLIMEEIMLQMAERRGIRVSDEAVNGHISTVAEKQKLTLKQFRKTLNDDGISYTEFRRHTKQNMIMDRLRRLIAEKEVRISKQEVEAHLAKILQGDQTEYNLSHILVRIPESATPEQVEKSRRKAEKVLKKLRKGTDFAQTAIAESDGPQSLKGGKMGWMKAAQLPSLFNEMVEKMKIGGISDIVRSPSGYHIVKLEKKRTSGGKHIVKQTLSRHILISPKPVLSDDDARKKLEKIRSRILTGEDFAKMAKAFSDDKGSARDGGNLGWNGPGKFVPAFEKNLNRLKQGEISPVFRSPFGWHIIQLMSRRKHDDTDTYQREQIYSQIYNRKATEAVENWQRQIRDEAYVVYHLDN